MLTIEFKTAIVNPAQIVREAVTAAAHAKTVPTSKLPVGTNGGKQIQQNYPPGAAQSFSVFGGIVILYM